MRTPAGERGAFSNLASMSFLGDLRGTKFGEVLRHTCLNFNSESPRPNYDVFVVLLIGSKSCRSRWVVKQTCRKSRAPQAQQIAFRYDGDIRAMPVAKRLSVISGGRRTHYLVDALMRASAT